MHKIERICLTQFVIFLQNMSFLNARQNNITRPLLPQQTVNEFVHMNNLKFALFTLHTQFSVVVEKRLEVFVTVQRCTGQTHVKCAQRSDIFVFLIFDKLHNYVFFWLNLEHLQDQTEKRRWFDVAAINSSDKPAKTNFFIQNQTFFKNKYEILT